MTRGLPRIAGGRLLAGLLLTLLPGLALAVLGVRALSEKEAALRTQHTATTALIRDRLVAELTRLETALRLEAAPLSQAGGASSVTSLASLKQTRSWLVDPFVVRDDGAVATAWVYAGYDVPAGEPLNQLHFRARIRDAETAEFAANDLETALKRYRSLLGEAMSPASQAALRVRVGRVLVKLRRFEDALMEYRTLMADADEQCDAGIPCDAVARSMVVTTLGELGRSVEQAQERASMMRHLVEHPWDVDRGYSYYLGTAASSSQPDKIPSAIATLQASIASVEWIRRDVRPHSSGAQDAARAVTIVADRNGAPAILRCMHASAASASARVMLCYVLEPGSAGGSLLSTALGSINLGEDVSVALSDGTRRVPSIPASGVPLAAAELPLMPGWRVLLFDQAGRSIGELVARERWMYGTLIAAMLLMLGGGVSFTLRASAREAELVRLKTEFVSNVSHELKTPLALIRMFAETLESGIVLDDAKRIEFSSVIRRESERLTHLINNVLDVARIEAGTKQYAMSRVDIVQVVRDVVATYRPFFDRLGFAVSVLLPDAAIDVDADPDAIAQALVNLFQNSIKYSEQHKAVRISVAAEEETVRIAVADRGVGIAAEDRPRIFDRYYRAGRKDATAPGSGLGLAIVKYTMDAHGGRAEVESTVGTGSVFTLVLPALTPRPELGPAVVPGPSEFTPWQPS